MRPARDAKFIPDRDFRRMRGTILPAVGRAMRDCRSAVRLIESRKSTSSDSRTIHWVAAHTRVDPLRKGERASMRDQAEVRQLRFR